VRLTIPRQPRGRVTSPLPTADSRAQARERAREQAPLLAPASAAMPAARLPSYPCSAKTSAATRGSRIRFRAAVIPAAIGGAGLAPRPGDKPTPAIP